MSIEIAGIKIETGIEKQNKRAPRSEFHEVLDSLAAKGGEAIGMSFVTDAAKVQTIRNIAKAKGLKVATNVVSKDEAGQPKAVRVWYEGVATETSEGETSEDEGDETASE